MEDHFDHINSEGCAFDCISKSNESNEWSATHIFEGHCIQSNPDWSDVQVIEFKKYTSGPFLPVDTTIRYINYTEFFGGLDLDAILDAHLPAIVVSVTEPFSLVKFLSSLFCSTRLYKHLHGERDLVFCLALHSVVELENLGLVLKSIHKALTGSNSECERFGAHWEHIGFQGNDPSTDFRSTGTFGLLQLLRLVTDEDCRAFARTVHVTSQERNRHFPFCVLCINLSSMVLANLRSGRLNGFSNQASSILEAGHIFYVGLLRCFSLKWRCDDVGIEGVGKLLQQLSPKVERETAAIFRHGADLLQKKQIKYAQEENDFTTDL